MTTNITADHRAAFEALASGDYASFALFSCFVNGEPAVAIVAVNRDGRQLCDHAAVRQYHAVDHTHHRWSPPKQTT